MSLDWRTIILVALILGGLFWQQEIREVLLGGWDLLLSGVMIPPFEEALELEPIEITLPETKEEEKEEQEEWIAITKVEEPEAWQEIGEKIQVGQEPVISKPKSMSLSEIETEIDKIALEVETIAEGVSQLAEKQQRLAEMQQRIDEISQTIEFVSQETVELVANPQVG